MRWEPLPSTDLRLLGLPWFEGNRPRLHRLPAGATGIPEGVRAQARFPAGARLRFRSDTTGLRLRCRRSGDAPPAPVDLCLDGVFRRSSFVPPDGESEVTLFEGLPRAVRDVCVYLPIRQELELLAAGVDDAASLAPPPPSARLPLVVYGSSIAQGVGAARPGMSYAAILGRTLDLDLVNLGFGGAGKAEPEVVDLVAGLEACCFVLDLGKSYGSQPATAYGAMLDMLRRRHPHTPVVCITPVYGTREELLPDFAELSAHTRAVVREAAAPRLRDDPALHVVEGPRLLSATDADGLTGDAVHPNDHGCVLIANRLAPILRRVIG